jgi:hypothetical protein
MVIYKPENWFRVPLQPFPPSIYRYIGVEASNYFRLYKNFKRRMHETKSSSLKNRIQVHNRSWRGIAVYNVSLLQAALYIAVSGHLHKQSRSSKAYPRNLSHEVTNHYKISAPAVTF